MSDYHRPLYSPIVTSDFLTKVIGIPQNHPDHKKYVSMIVGEEMMPIGLKDTLNDLSLRTKRFQSEENRNILREQIVTEMMTMTRLDDDEMVSLGNGGARPKSKQVKSDRRAFYVMGLPASGKSSICGALCDQYGAYLLDSDLVKRKLPEFSRKSGASLVHEESSIITMGGNFKNISFKSLMEHCFLYGYNICLPKIGSDVRSVTKLFTILRACGYSIYVVLVSLDRRIATLRAFQRYLKTNRYVPLSMIFDGYANDPILCYYRLRKYLEDNGNKFVDEMIALSSDVMKNQPMAIVDKLYAGPILGQYLSKLTPKTYKQ